MSPNPTPAVDAAAFTMISSPAMPSGLAVIVSPDLRVAWIGQANIAMMIDLGQFPAGSTMNVSVKDYESVQRQLAAMRKS